MTLAVNGRFYAARVDGVQRVARHLVSELTRRIEVALYVPRDAEPPGAVVQRSGVVRGVLRGPLWEHVELPACAVRDRPAFSLDPANAGPSWGGPRVLILHDVFPVTHPGWYARAFRLWFRATAVPAARRAARVVMFSEWAKRQAVRVLGIPDTRIAVITQGLAPFHAPPSDEVVRKVLARFRLEHGYLLASGAGDLRKNGAFIEGVSRRLQAGGRRPQLVLVGASHSHIHARAPIPGDQDGPRRLGYVTDHELRALYAAAGVFCFPSLAEGFGRPPLEAMGCGAPVLAAPYGCAAEVLGRGARILPLDPNAWADAIALLLGDGEARRRQVEAGRAHASRFRWDTAARQLLEACGAVTHGASGFAAASATMRGI